jgi:hypothetical protein
MGETEALEAVNAASVIITVIMAYDEECRIVSNVDEFVTQMKQLAKKLLNY